MDKRFFLALLLSLIVVALSQVLFPTQVKKEAVPAVIARAPADTTSANGAGMAMPPNPARLNSTDSAASSTRQSGERTTVSTGKAIYTFTNVGASPVSVVMTDYAN